MAVQEQSRSLTADPDKNRRDRVRDDNPISSECGTRKSKQPARRRRYATCMGSSAGGDGGAGEAFAEGFVLFAERGRQAATEFLKEFADRLIFLHPIVDIHV
jgi:hypothetical protein